MSGWLMVKINAAPNTHLSWVFANSDKAREGVAEVLVYLAWTGAKVTLEVTPMEIQK